MIAYVSPGPTFKVAPYILPGSIISDIEKINIVNIKIMSNFLNGRLAIFCN
jgi:hypothetical protein